MNHKYIKGGSNYKYVEKWVNLKGVVCWFFRMPDSTRVKVESEREAAIRVDKAFIERGKEPVNILKRK